MMPNSFRPIPELRSASPESPTSTHVTICLMTDHIVALLIAERDRLTRAIEALQGPTKRIGRPPKNPLANAPSWVTSSNPLKNPEPVAPVRRKRKFTAAQRKEQAARMKAYWAAKRKAK
jgi:hypothetical protein